DVHVMSASSSQKPIVSPYQRGTSAPRRGTAPSMRNWRPTLMLVVKLRATPVVIVTRLGVTTKKCGLICGCVATVADRRMKPSGQQYCEGHCEAAFTTSW